MVDTATLGVTVTSVSLAGVTTIPLPRRNPGITLLLLGKTGTGTRVDTARRPGVGTKVVVDPGESGSSVPFFNIGPT